MDNLDLQNIQNAIVAFLNSSGIDVIAVVSAAIALIGMAVTISETRKQRRISLAELRQVLDDRTFEWGSRAIDALSEAEAAIMTHAAGATVTDFNAQRQAVLGRISSLVDHGRLFFPNIETDDHGAEKESAFKGVRPPILDVLIYAIYEIETVDPMKTDEIADSCDYLRSCRRLLVSELQGYLDPKTRNEVLERFNHRLEDQREDAILRAGELGLRLNARRPGILTHHDDIGWTRYVQDNHLTAQA